METALILELAGWLDVPFKIQMHKWVAELLRTGRIDLGPILSPAELLLKQCQQLVDHEHRVYKLEARQDDHDEQFITLGNQVAEVASRQVLTSVEFFSVVGWARLQKKRISPEQAKALGKKATALSRQLEVEVQTLPSGRWGWVNAYHRSILEQVI